MSLLDSVLETAHLYRRWIWGALIVSYRFPGISIGVIMGVALAALFAHSSKRIGAGEGRIHKGD